ncbi:MAG: hypothetical protein GXO78_14400 [Calditrichaeota bacterium]|nr:hypothetical protein [Calditrichota bacterium]
MRGQYCWIVSGILGMVFLLGCQSENSSPGKMESQVVQEQGMADVQVPEVTFDSISRERWEAIRQLQMRIRQQPRETGLRAELVQLAYGPSWKAIFVTGTALLKHPESGRAIPVYQAEQAAFADAQRWAAYIQQWREHPLSPNFGELNRWQTLPSSVLYKENRGDTLVLYLAFQELAPLP